MEYVGAFVVAGILCALCQVVLELKVPLPVILVGGYTLGALVTPLGWCEKLVEWGGAGMFATVIDAGEATYGAIETLFAGVPLRLLIFLIIPVAVTLTGIIGGLIRLKVEQGKGAPAVEAAAH